MTRVILGFLFIPVLLAEDSYASDLRDDWIYRRTRSMPNLSNYVNLFALSCKEEISSPVLIKQDLPISSEPLESLEYDDFYEDADAYAISTSLSLLSTDIEDDLYSEDSSINEH